MTQQGGATVAQWRAWWDGVQPAEVIELLEERLREEPLRDAVTHLPTGGA